MNKRDACDVLSTHHNSIVKDGDTMVAQTANGAATKIITCSDEC